MNIYFDIETIPSQIPGIKEEFAAEVEAPGQYKKPESIAEWLRENREAEAEKAWLKTSFDGGLGHICVIGWAVDDAPAQSLSVADLSRDQEASLLRDWFKALGLYKTSDLPTFICHNGIGFDLPFLWKRAMILGIKPPAILPRNQKPWADSVVDTMLLWDSAQRVGGSMDHICRLMGLDGKGDDMDGSKVWPAVRDGQIDKVSSYCRGDVERTRRMYKRMTFQS